MISMIPMILSALATAYQLGQVIVPELITAGKTALALVESGDAPTAAQQSALDAGQEHAHAILQAAQPEAV